MKGDDDEEEDAGAIGVARYPCLPSLVALQQMRNRLHLAHVGRKLMKWTAMAVGRELRKIAAGLIEVSENYDRDVRNAYIQLARCRYFYPNLNKLVSSNPPQFPKAAKVTVETTQRSVTGCKVLNFEIMVGKDDPYAHLALEKGGQEVAEAKRMWLELLKKMILLLQLRTSYIYADFSHKSANKKWNVLSKIVIPRTEKSIKYILDELEERDREEFFRMKKILAVKAKKKLASEKRFEKKKPEEEPCPVCEELRAALALGPIDRCFVCGKLISGQPDPADEENKHKLEEFKSQIEQVVDMTKEIDEQGIVEENFKDFLDTAEVLKERLVMKEKERKISEEVPLDAPLERLCPKCIERLKKQIEELQRIKEEEEIVEQVNVEVREDDEITAKRPSEVNFVEEEQEYGLFEIEYKEITKMIRTRNEDGTISEERKVVRVKKEVKTPIPKKQINKKRTMKSITNEVPVATEGTNADLTSVVSEESKQSKQSKDPKTVVAFVPNIKKAHSVLAIPPSPVEVASRSCVSDCSEFSILDDDNIKIECSDFDILLTSSEMILDTHDPDECSKDTDSFISDISDF